MSKGKDVKSLVTILAEDKEEKEKENTTNG